LLHHVTTNESGHSDMMFSSFPSWFQVKIVDFGFLASVLGLKPSSNVVAQDQWFCRCHDNKDIFA